MGSAVSLPANQASPVNPNKPLEVARTIHVAASSSNELAAVDNTSSTSIVQREESRKYFSAFGTRATATVVPAEISRVPQISQVLVTFAAPAPAQVLPGNNSLSSKQSVDAEEKEPGIQVNVDVSLGLRPFTSQNNNPRANVLPSLSNISTSVEEIGNLKSVSTSSMLTSTASTLPCRNISSAREVPGTLCMTNSPMRSHNLVVNPNQVGMRSDSGNAMSLASLSVETPRSFCSKQTSPLHSETSLCPSTPNNRTSTFHGSHRTSIAQYIDYERRHAQEQQYHLHKKREYVNQLHGSPNAALSTLSVIYLPRGGIYVHTPAGPVQFGMPPETIKDSMKLGLTLPTYFVVPKERFNLTAGINVGEFEFPAYYNFFFKRKRINLITTPQVEPLIRSIFTETLIGPSQIEPPIEYGENVPQECYPDLNKEMSYFAVNPFDKTPLTVDSLLSFHFFDTNGSVQLEQDVSIQDLGEEYSVTVKERDPLSGELIKREIARVTSDVLCTPVIDEREKDGKHHHRSSADESHAPSSLDPLHNANTQSVVTPILSAKRVRAEEVTAEHFVPPHFGITMLGNSDGFDSNGTTTGFVLWMNRRGIMVDPPPHSGALLKRHGISARLMRGVILTHCLPEVDTRILTNCGLLFLDEIERKQAMGVEVLFGCYEVKKVVGGMEVESKELKYVKGTLRIKQKKELPRELVQFTSPGERKRWTEESGLYGRGGQSDDDDDDNTVYSHDVSLRVTPDHEMFVQTGDAKTRGVVTWDPVTTARATTTQATQTQSTTTQATEVVERPHRKVWARQLLSTDPRQHVRLLACAEAGYVPLSASRRNALQAQLKLTDRQFLHFVELFGFWLGNGSMSYALSVDGYNAVRFSQVKEADLDWLKKSFRKVGLRSDVDWKSHVNSSGSREDIYITAPHWFALFDQEFGVKYMHSHSQYNTSSGHLVTPHPSVDPPSTTRALCSTLTTISSFSSSSSPIISDDRGGQCASSSSAGALTHLSATRSITPPPIASCTHSRMSSYNIGSGCGVGLYRMDNDSMTRCPYCGGETYEAACDMCSNLFPHLLTPLPSKSSTDQLMCDEDDDEYSPSPCSSSEVSDGEASAMMVDDEDIPVTFHDEDEAVSTKEEEDEVKKDEEGCVIPPPSAVAVKDEPRVKEDGGQTDDPMINSSSSDDDTDEEDEPDDELPSETTKSVKWLPDWALAELSRDQMRLLIEGLRRADVAFAQGDNTICTSSIRFRDQLQHALLQCGYSPYSTLMYSAGTIHGYSAGSKTLTIAHFNQLTKSRQRRWKPITATFDAWRVTWTDASNSSGDGSCWPFMPRQSCISTVKYDSKRDGRIWCVEVEHHDHLIIAQRAQRNNDGVVTKQSRPIIVGNCHADHDAGTFQKILEEGKVVLMTTEVILNSFLRKYSAISGLDPSFLRKLFVFRPVLAGQRTAVYGGHVEFFYSLHSIPCVGFSAFCEEKSFVYSGDSFNDPAGIRKLHEQGFISLARRDKLINFPWHHDLILHEAGVPPIHTPLSTLEALSDDVKQRLYIVHKPSKDVPTSSGLKSALVGPENTLVICRGPTHKSSARALEVLDLLSGIDLFSGFDLSRALEILQCATYLDFGAGDTLIREGTLGDTLYVVAMGTVCVTQDGYALKQLTVGDHFGEMSIVTGEKRTASIKALTPVEVIQFSKQEFLYIVRHTDAVARLQQLGVIQRSPSWQAISSNTVLVNLTSSQKTYLQSILHYRLVQAGEVLWQSGEVAHEAVLVADGSFHFTRAKEQAPFRRGAFVADMRALLLTSALTTTLQCAEAGAVYAVTRVNLCKFLDDNPGFKVLVMNRRFIE